MQPSLSSGLLLLRDQSLLLGHLFLPLELLVVDCGAGARRLGSLLEAALCELLLLVFL